MLRKFATCEIFFFFSETNFIYIYIYIYIILIILVIIIIIIIIKLIKIYISLKDEIAHSASRNSTCEISQVAKISASAPAKITQKI